MTKNIFPTNQQKSLTKAQFSLKTLTFYCDFYNFQHEFQKYCQQNESATHFRIQFSRNAKKAI